MADFGLNRNGSGYYDETAYKAFMGIAKSGDIWTTYNGQSTVLILRNQGTLCNVLTLLDTHKHSRMMEINGMVTYYTDPAMVHYLFNEKLGRFVQRLPEDEFAKAREAVEDAMGFGKQAVEADKRKEVHDLLDMILDKVGAM